MADAEMPVGLSDPSKMEEHIEGVEAEEREIVDSGDVIERPIDTSNTHPLEPSSTFWFDNPNGKSKQATWGNSLRPVCTFSTVEDFWCNLQVEYASEENASMVYTALSVDKELQPDKVKRDMILSGSQLLVHFTAVEARFLRASFSAFMDILVLATKTIEQFGAN